MDTNYSLIATLIFGALLIVFNELVARRIVKISNDIFQRERNEKLTRIICIIIGTIYVIFASLSILGPVPATR